MLARKWEREMKVQAVMYICPICSRKFHNADQMKLHELESKLHAFNLAKLDKHKLAI